ncbi:hypothetical protein HJD18_04285 [Thermoleophilia bacterium SCSIO 60948]|nr:hypothetical protein HJD18_04285 [Thermoleophilia bacterium SCSIO 60948]
MSRGAKFWINGFLPVLFIALAIGLAWAWNANGGWPAGHDDSGVAKVPGQSELDLPEGENRIYWQAEATGSGENRSVGERPDELAVRITPAGGGEPAEIDDVPSWTFSSIVGDTGFEPYAEAEIDAAGPHEIVTKAPGGAIPAGAELTFGPPNWNPGGSLAAGTAMVAIVVLLFGAANWALFRFALRNMQAGDSSSA